MIIRSLWYVIRWSITGKGFVFILKLKDRSLLADNSPQFYEIIALTTAKTSKKIK